MSKFTREQIKELNSLSSFAKSYKEKKKPNPDTGSIRWYKTMYKHL